MTVALWCVGVGEKFGVLRSGELMGTGAATDLPHAAKEAVMHVAFCVGEIRLKYENYKG